MQPVELVYCCGIGRIRWLCLPVSPAQALGLFHRPKRWRNGMEVIACASCTAPIEKRLVCLFCSSPYCRTCFSGIERVFGMRRDRLNALHYRIWTELRGVLTFGLKGCFRCQPLRKCEGCGASGYVDCTSCQNNLVAAIDALALFPAELVQIIVSFIPPKISRLSSLKLLFDEPVN